MPVRTFLIELAAIAGLWALTSSPASAVILSVTDPVGDDHGPGTFQYPTSPDFKPGAFDITNFQIYETSTTTWFVLTTANLAPTFGAPLGAQLIDVYLHDPAAAAADTSTQAAFASRNYTIAGPDAWSRLVEIQGFGQSYRDAHGNVLGTISSSVDVATNTVTFSVPTASLGAIGPGWVVTVALTAQDGFSPDLARGFAPTAQPFLLGLCPVGDTAPICSIDPRTAPKVMDTITPLGVDQSTELDPTLGPVVLAGITVPEGGTLGAPPSIPEPSTLSVFASALWILGLLRRFRHGGLGPDKSHSLVGCG